MKTAQQYIDSQLPPRLKGGLSMEMPVEMLEEIIRKAKNEGMKKAAKICHNSIQSQGPYFKTLILSKVET